MAAGVPLVACSALGWQGQLAVWGAPGGPCYRCLHPEPPPPAARGSCADSGVLGPVAAALGALQALEVLKLLLRAGQPLSGRLLLLDGLRGTARVARLRGPRPDCCCRDPAALAARFPPEVLDEVRARLFCLLTLLCLNSSSPGSVLCGRGRCGAGAGGGRVRGAAGGPAASSGH